MVQLIQVSDWRVSRKVGGHYENMLAAIGSEDFGPRLREAVLSTTAGARRVYLFEASGREDSDLHYYSCEPRVAEMFPSYRKLYQALDPVCDAYRSVPCFGDLAIMRVRPADIASTAFRRKFYDEPEIIERLSVIQRGHDTWRVLSVARHRCDGYFSDEEIGVTLDLALLALPMLPLNRQRPSQMKRLSVVQSEERFARRYPLLTIRELHVCARAAVGMTVEATALDLGIAKTSVLTYRKRAYRRLGVTSPFELCALISD